jgi:hypothetical protein
MEAVVDHQVAEVDPLHQVVVAILQLLQALVNASALREKAAWLGGWEKNAPIIVSINSHTKCKSTRTRTLSITKEVHTKLCYSNLLILTVVINYYYLLTDLPRFLFPHGH